MLRPFIGTLLALLGGAAALAAQATPTTVVITEGTNIAADLSPDGRTIAFDLLGRIWTLPRAGGAATVLTDEYGDARQPAWSPDGRRIAFQSYRDGTWHIWSVAANGTDLRQHTTGGFDHREPDWTPDGSALVFSSDRAGHYDIWRLTLATSTFDRLTDDPGDEFGPAIGPDGAIAFASTRRDGPGIWVRSASGATALWATAAGQAAAPSFSPDGSTIAFNLFARNESQVMVAGRGETPRPITPASGDAFPFRATWISATELLYTGDGKLLIAGLDGRPATAIPFEGRVSFTRSPYRRAVRGVDAASRLPVRGIVSPAISPDGQTFVFTALGDLWALTEGKATRLTEGPAIEIDAQWSPDGRWLVYASDQLGTMDLWLREMTSGATRQLTRNTGGAALPAWSPDGQSVVFQVQRGLGTEMQRVVVATGAVSTLRANLFQPSRATFSPDGRIIAVTALRANSARFREGRNDILLFSADGAGDRWVVPPAARGIGSRGIDGPVWSPDGTQMAFVLDGGLWRQPVTPTGEPNGPPVRLSDELANSLSWTGDSKSVAYQGTDGLRIARLSDGMTRRIAVPLTWRRSVPTRRVVVHAGRLWDGIAGTTRANMDVVIVGHRIARVVPHAAALHRDSVIDASARTVIPGLADAHAHLGFGTGEALGRVWLAYGVTTVRDPASDPFSIRERREAVESGARVGPRELATGRIFDGDRIYYGFNNAITPGAQLDAELTRAAALEFDLIKTYVRLPDVIQHRIIDVAHQHGIPVSSHELYPAVAFGADHVEHIRGTSRRGYSPKVSARFRSYQDVIALLTASGMSLTPTIGIQGGFASLVAEQPATLDDPRLEVAYGAEYVANLRRSMTGSGPFGPNPAGVAAQGETVRRVVAGGGRIIAGTDAPIIPYGLSLHTELQHYVAGGLTPVEALMTATSGFAAAMGLSGQLGAIAAGRLADLAIVDGNPLETITDARRVRVVVKNGEVFTIEELLAGPVRRNRGR